MKKIKSVLLILTGIFVSFTYATNYPVEPANNGLAKKVISRIFTDPGLQKNTTLEDRIVAAKAANRMSELILQSIRVLGIANDWFITEDEVKKLNDYMYKHYHNLMVSLHWDDERWIETGFHRVVNNWGVQKWYIPLKRKYKKANRIADGIFHLWLYPTKDPKRILNEDGNKNVRWRLIARWLSVYLKKDLGIKSWSKKAWLKSQIKRLKKEREEKIKALRKEMLLKLSKVKNKKEYRIIKAEYRKKIKEIKAEYNKKIKNLRK